MKYTPLDIQRREFEKAFRGVDRDEVRSFLHELAGEWEEVLQENQRMRAEILDLRERIQQYQEQDRIFRETLLQAQKTREELLEGAHRERTLILREAEFKAEELAREAQTKAMAFEGDLRALKLERIRVLQDLDGLLGRARRFLQEEAPDMFPPAEVTRLLDDVFPESDAPGGESR
nr:DivIVA domain-containing protein [uncultured Holophaga sp.]